MIKLVIDNSICRIQGLSPKQEIKLKALLSYKLNSNQAYYSGKAYNTTKTMLSKRGEFPTGLLYIVENFLSGENAHREDVRTRPITRSKGSRIDERRLFGVTPYPEQLEAVKTALNANRGIICCPTGFGKSLIIAMLCHAFDVKTLIVVPNLELKHQLIHTLTMYFGPKLVGKDKKITIDNIDALEIGKAIDKDMVIIDEFHHSGAKTYRKLNEKSWNKVYYKFGLTATPFRSNDDERLLLESVLSKVIYRLDYSKAVAKGYIVPVEAYYLNIPMQGNSAGTVWAEVYSNLVVNNIVRNAIISNLISSLNTAGKSTLCLVKEIAHGNKLTKRTNVPFMNGQDEDSREFLKKFNNLEIKQLVGTTGVLGEGVDTKPAEWVIIAGLGKSKNSFMQQVGRGLRKYPGKDSCKVIIFRDKSHKWTLAHFNAQCKILKEEYGCIPVKLP